MSRNRMVAFGVSALLGLWGGGCGEQEPAAVAADQGLAAAACLTHQGFAHCALGGATLAQSRDGATLTVSGARAAEKDGVAIALPPVTSFTPTGKVGGKAGSTFIARSLSDGVSTSSLTVRKGIDRDTVTVAYTGTGDTSRYDAVLYNRGQVVNRISNLGADAPVAIFYPTPRCPPGTIGVWPDCRYIWPNPFHIAFNGGCVWDMILSAPGQVALADGTTVAVDRISFEEIVPAAGSYPYLTFNRIDYTSDGGSFQLGTETAR